MAVQYSHTDHVSMGTLIIFAKVSVVNIGGDYENGRSVRRSFCVHDDS